MGAPVALVGLAVVLVLGLGLVEVLLLSAALVVSGGLVVVPTSGGPVIGCCCCIVCEPPVTSVGLELGVVVVAVPMGEMGVAGGVVGPPVMVVVVVVLTFFLRSRNRFVDGFDISTSDVVDGIVLMKLVPLALVNRPSWSPPINCTVCCFLVILCLILDVEFLAALLVLVPSLMDGD